MSGTLHGCDVELEHRAGFRRAPTSLQDSTSERAQEAERRRFALRAWISRRLEDEVRHAKRQAETAPTPRAIAGTETFVQGFAGIVVADPDLSADVQGDGEGGVVLVIDRLPSGRRLILEFDDTGALRQLSRVTVARVDDLAGGITTDATLEAFRWLCQR